MSITKAELKRDNQTLLDLSKFHEDEMSRLQGELKKANLANHELTAQLAEKEKENLELTRLKFENILDIGKLESQLLTAREEAWDAAVDRLTYDISFPKLNTPPSTPPPDKATYLKQFEK